MMDDGVGRFSSKFLAFQAERREKRKEKMGVHLDGVLARTTLNTGMNIHTTPMTL